MKVILQDHKIHSFGDPKFIEVAGRTCYKSEDKITEDSADRFIKMLIKKGHEAMIEHCMASVCFTTNRGVSHELVRHRMASYAQESTRYVKYDGDEMTFILPPWMDTRYLGRHDTEKCYHMETKCPEDAWLRHVARCALTYDELIQPCEDRWTPEQARGILPNDLKTEIIVTANFREWRHIFKLRAIGVTGRPHPHMVDLMTPLVFKFAELAPSVFGDQAEELKNRENI